MQRIITKREKTILYLTIFVVIFAVFFNLLIMPALSKYDGLNRQIKANFAKLKKYRWLLSQKDTIQSKYQSFSSNLKVSGTEKDTQISALAALEEMAKNSDIRIVDVRPDRGRSEGLSAKEITIELRTEGPIEGQLKFIYNIENSLLLLKVKEFQLSAKSGQSLEGSLLISQPELTQ